MRRVLRKLSFVILSALFTGLALAIASGAAAPVVTFVDATEQAHIRFTHNNGAFGKKYLPETMGSGGLFLDVDGDGWQDILLINSKNWPGRPGTRSLPALYRNAHDGTFVDITRGSGLDVELYGIGAAAADFDNDGRIDIYITALGGNRLFRNLGGGKFADLTRQAGVGDGGFSTSALWFDYNGDGKLDLFVAHYVNWSESTDLFCTLDGKNKSYCPPESYRGGSPALYQTRGDATFDNAPRQAAFSAPPSRGLGAAMPAYAGAGRIDLFAANAPEPNRL